MLSTHTIKSDYIESKEGWNRDGISNVVTTIQWDGCSTKVSTIFERIQAFDNQAIDLLNRIDSPIAGTITNVIAGTIAERDIKLLATAINPVKRETLLISIGLKNLRQNYDDNIKHLEEMNWLSMSISAKPTSPN